MTPAKTGYAPVNGINMYYEIHGEGKPLILIHGGGSTLQTSWATVLPELAKNYKAVAVELQAHGHTGDRDAPESFAQDAADVATLMNYLEISKAHVMGFSNGAQTAMEIAITYPQLVDKLVIISAFYKREGAIEGLFEGMNHATLDNMPAYLKEAFRKINNDPAALQTMFEKDRDRMIGFSGWSDVELQSIKAPTLIVSGSNDVAKREHTIEMANMIANSDLMILPGNHGSFIGEGEAGKSASKIPALAVMAIQEFLGK